MDGRNQGRRTRKRSAPADSERPVHQGYDLRSLGRRKQPTPDLETENLNQSAEHSAIDSETDSPATSPDNLNLLQEYGMLLSEHPRPESPSSNAELSPFGPISSLAELDAALPLNLPENLSLEEDATTPGTHQDSSPPSACCVNCGSFIPSSAQPNNTYPALQLPARPDFNVFPNGVMPVPAHYLPIILCPMAVPTAQPLYFSSQHPPGTAPGFSTERFNQVERHVNF